MRKFLSVLICMTLGLSCVSGVSFAADTSEEFIIDSLEEYVVYEAVIENDGYIGIPVGAKTYVKEATTSATPLIIYVVNTNTERVGRTSDEVLITDFLNRGYAVIVLDYYNNEKAVYPDLDWSLNKIKTTIRSASGMSKYLAGGVTSTDYVYILPAGYDVTRQLAYWSLDKHGYSGTFEFIMDVWNADFLGVWGTKGVITFEEDTKIIKGAGESEYLEFTAGQQITVKDYTAMLTGGKVTDISQCIKRNGKPITMDLFMDIVYPSDPENEVPVLMYAQSSQNTVGTWNTEARPHMSGFLFRGYAGVLFDFAYVPMSRADNFGYFDGDGAGCTGNITGDNYTYSIGMPSSTKSDNAAVRYTRWLADMYPDKYKFDADKYGAVGISKSGSAVRLGHPDPESLPEQRIFEDANGLTRYENGETEDILDVNGNVLVYGGQEQPWLTYKDGSKIPSNVQFTSTTVGSGQYGVADGAAPMYIYGTIQDGGSQWGYYPDVLSRCFTHDIPTMYYAGLDAGHTLCIGTDADTGNDAYEALFTTSDYWLRDIGAKCEYIKPLNGTQDVSATTDITVKFNGSVPETEISKIKITNAITGEAVEGSWKDSYGDTEWTFTPYNLKGGNTYTVYVPASIVGTNGKNIVAAKSSSFTVVPEKAVGATAVSENMTATSQDGVYFEVSGADIESSTTTSVRFSVKNDAANNVLVYSADENGEADELLGKINLDGAGEYDLDVTDYVKSLSADEKAAFVLMAEKATGENVVYSMDFEGLASIPSNVTANSKVIRELSGEKNATDGGSASYKVTGVKKVDTYEPYHSYYYSNNNVVNFYPLGDSLADSDYGRKFNVKFKLYDTAKRVIQISVGSTASKPALDGTAPRYSETTEQDAWKEFSFDYRTVGDLFKTRRNVNITAECHGADSPNKPIYIDDFVVTEYITDVEIASEADGADLAPALVLHPANKQSASVTSAGYVESGNGADTSFEDEDTLLVSGRSKAMSLSGDKMVYAKVDLSEFDAAKVNTVTINVTAGNGGIEVYGVAEDVNVSDANYINVIANDRFSSGVDLSKVYGGAALDSTSVAEGGTYSFDITDYAEYMTDSGKSYGYLIFVSKTEASPVVYEEDFNDGKFDGSALYGGDIRDFGVDSTQDLDNNGYAYRMVSKANYDRLYFNIMNSASWTEADIGRAFEVTYWFKADAAGSFLNRIQKVSSDKADQVVTQTYTTANEWQKFTYNFVYNQTAHDNGYNRFSFRFNGMPSNTMYIDNIVIRETSIGNVSFEFAEETPQEGAYYYTANCNNGSVAFVTDNAEKYPEEAEWCNNVVRDGLIVGYQAIDSSNAGEKFGLVTEENYPVADGTQKSVRLKSRYNYNRLFVYNVMDSLTEDDLGRSFKLSFYVKASKAGSFATSVTSVTHKSTYNYNAATHTIAENQVGKWVKITCPITVTSDMITNQTGLVKITSFNFSQAEGDLVDIYFDNFVSLEILEETEEEAGYVYENSFNSYTGIEHNGFEQKTLEDGVTKVNRLSRKTTEDRNANAATKGAMEILTNKNYNRVYLNNIFESLTEDDIGRKYKVSFWLKSDRAGTMALSMSEYSLKGAAYTGEIKHSLTVAEDEVNTWKKYSFEITVDEYMVAAEADQLLLFVGAFTKNSTVETALYIDDVKSIELIDGAEADLLVSEAKTVSSQALTDDEALAPAASKPSTYGVAMAGIHKAYISFEGSEAYKKTQKATLYLDITSSNGQTVKVYGLINSAYPDLLTYNTAPASNNDETINENLAYGGAPLAEIKAAEPGIYGVDVSDYVKENAPSDCLFAIVSEDIGGTQYISLDFETFTMTKGVDYIAESDIDISGGAAKVAGSKLQLMNIFGNDNAPVKAGEVYEISLDVTADSDCTVTVGAAKPDGEMVGEVYSASASAAAAQTIKFTYTATEEDEAAGVCSVAIETSVAGFSADNLSVASTTAVVISKTAELLLEIAKDAEIADFDEVTINVNVVDGKNVNINGEDKYITVTEKTYRGKVLDMKAEGDGEFMYWIDTKANTILSYDETYSYTVGTDRSISAVYADGDAFVTFTSMANKLVASGISGSVKVPEDPYVYGYQFAGWYLNNEKQAMTVGEYVTAEENVCYVAGFVKDNSVYKVTVDAAEETHGYNEKVTYTAEAEKDGKTFSYWKRDGEIVSYSKEYSFYVNGDTTLESVYGESAEAGVVLAMANPVLVGTDKIAFFAERDIPADCSVIETGILIGTSSGLTIENAAVKATAKSTLNKGQYTIRKANVKQGDTYYGAAYAVYRDASGSVCVAYSNEVSYKVE